METVEIYKITLRIAIFGHFSGRWYAEKARSFSRNQASVQQMVSKCVLHISVNILPQEKKKKNSIILVALIAHHTPKVTLFALQPHAGLCRRVPVILRCHASNEMTPSFISKVKERELDSSKINTLNITSSYGSALHHELRR